MTRRPLLNADVALVPSVAGELQTALPVTPDTALCLAQFVDSYCDPRFGSQSMREIDLLPFRAPIQTTRVDLSRGRQAISHLLRTTDARSGHLQQIVCLKVYKIL